MAEISQPTIEESSRFNFFTSIWIVPFIALVISLWLVYQHFAKMGPEIQIVFVNSGGLEAGQSVVRYRNVPVGKVTRIEIEENGKGVVVIVRMNKEAERFLNKATRFWVVKPEVGYSGVSGLETLISGSYIAMHAVEGKEEKRHFKGLDSPYRDINSGAYVLLRSKSVSGIKVGTPINYHNIQVGEVEHLSLSHDRKSVEVVAFIKKEYADIVNITTKFWVQGLADIGLQGGRLDVKLAPILSYLAFGGITLESKLDKKYPKTASNYFYLLYESQYEAESKKIGQKLREMYSFGFKFRGKISGIKKGASIQYQGFDVGEVSAVSLRYNSQSHMMEGAVSGDIDVSIFADANRSGFDNLNLAVRDGLRAQLTSVNPLINSLFIDLVFAKNTAPVALIRNDGSEISFPVLDVQKNSLLDELTQFTNTLNRLDIGALLTSTRQLIDGSAKPLQAALKNLDKAVISFKTLADESSAPLSHLLGSLTKSSDSLEGMISDKAIKEMPAKINKAIAELNKTLRTTKKVLRGYRSNSLFGKRVTEMLKEINHNSEESKRLLRKLNKKPNALILGN